MKNLFAMICGFVVMAALAAPVAALPDKEVQTRMLTEFNGRFISGGDDDTLCMVKNITHDTRYGEEPLSLVYKGQGDYFITFGEECVDVKQVRSLRYQSWYVHVVPDENGRRWVEVWMKNDVEYVDGETVKHPLPEVWQTVGFADEAPFVQYLLDFYEQNKIYFPMIH